MSIAAKPTACVVALLCAGAFAQAPTPATATAPLRTAVAQKNAQVQAVTPAPGPAHSPALTADNAQAPRSMQGTGRRDPFLSPVVNHSMVSSACSSGKKCLPVDQITLKGILSSPSGMIAVVVNTLGKAYFLRENDSVLRGRVLRITAESVIFEETVYDKLGKPKLRQVERRLVPVPAA
jgi:hypothetical protein